MANLLVNLANAVSLHLDDLTVVGHKTVNLHLDICCLGVYRSCEGSLDECLQLLCISLILVCNLLW